MAANILTAICRTLTNVPILTRIVERCIESSVSVAQPSWQPVISALEIPEVYESEYYYQCCSSSYILSLYLGLKQRMLRVQSPDDEKRIIEWFSKWIYEVPILKGEEHKMLLLWIEMIALLWNQLVFASSPHAVDRMHSFGQSLLKYGEDRKGDGILSALGLGDKSPYPVEFRLAARALGTFIECQFHEQFGFRTTDTPFTLSKTAEKALQSLTSLVKNKEYSHLISAINAFQQFCSNPSHCMTHILQLCTSVCTLLYPNIRWLRR